MKHVNNTLLLVSGMSQVPVVRLQIESMAISRPMRQHTILRRQAHFRSRLRPLRILERRRRLRRQNRTKTSRPRIGRKQYEILLGRFQQYLSRLLRQPHPNRTGIVLYGVSHLGWRRAELFRSGGDEWGDCRTSDISVSMLIGKYKRYGRARRSDSWTYILRTFARGTLDGATKGTLKNNNTIQSSMRSYVTCIDCFCLVLLKCCESEKKVKKVEFFLLGDRKKTSNG